MPIEVSKGVKKTRRQHLLQAEVSTGKEYIPIIEIPEAGVHLWKWFWKLSRRRTSSLEAVNPITFEEIVSWIQVTEEIVYPWEIDILVDMDDAYLTAIANERNPKTES